MASQASGPRFEVMSGDISFRAATGARRKVFAGQTTTEIPAESVPWLLGAGLIRPAGRTPTMPVPDSKATEGHKEEGATVGDL